MSEPARSRDISPFIDTADNIRCPSCNHPHSFHDLNQEGGRQCDGCGREIRLSIASYDHYGEHRNVPEQAKEDYR